MVAAAAFRLLLTFLEVEMVLVVVELEGRPSMELIVQEEMALMELLW